MAAGLPIETQRFLSHLYDYFYARDSDKVKHLYEVEFQNVTDLHYAHSLWPNPDQVAAYYVDQGKMHEVIFLLYQELYYRHAFSRNSERLRWEERLGSWFTYTVLFEYLVNNECDDNNEEAGICLPQQWLWDMFDEFVFQFQDTQRRKWELIMDIQKGNRKPCTEEEELQLEKLCDPEAALAFLYDFVKQTQICEILQKAPSLAAHNGEVSLSRQIGYYACVSLLRMNNLFCDYGHALVCVKHLELGPKSFAHTLPSCFVTLHYNVAFAKLMCKEFVDAAKAASHVLAVTGRTRPFFQAALPHTRVMVAKMVDKITNILLICDALSPQVRPDDYIMNRIKEQHKSDLLRLANPAEADELVDLFRSIIPKFVSPAVWDQRIGDALIEMQSSAEIAQRQIALFSQDVSRLKRIDQLLSFAKLYHNVSLEKLATLMGLITPGAEASEVERIKDDVRAELLSVKSLAASMAIDFVVDEDSVHIMEQPVGDSCHEQFMKQANRIEEWIAQVQKIDLSKVSSAEVF